MIRLIRSVTVMPGKTFDYLALAKQLAAIATQATGKEIKIAGSVGGNPLTFAYLSTYSDMAEMEAAFLKLMASADYQAAVRKVESFVVPGSYHDQIWRDF